MAKPKPVVTPEVTAESLSADLVLASLGIREARARARKILLAPELIAKLRDLFPSGSLVRYIGGRVGERTGAEGTVVDYRDANGLYIEFLDPKTGGTYRGSAVPGRVILLRKGPAPEAEKKTAKKK